MFLTKKYDTLEFLASRETFPTLREAMCTTSIPMRTMLEAKVGTLKEVWHLLLQEGGLAFATGGDAAFPAEEPGCDR